MPNLAANPALSISVTRALTWSRTKSLARSLLITLGIATSLGGCAAAQAPRHGANTPANMVYISGGAYTPLYKENGLVNIVQVAPFFLDQYPVTNREYANFIAANPNWQPQNVSPIFADPQYLSALKNATTLPNLNAEASPGTDENGDKPVTFVPWYAAMAYCKAADKTLPSMDQWEFAAGANSATAEGVDNPAFRKKILDWYAKPASEILPNVQDTEANSRGVHGLHGVVWEHVSDFNNALVSGESRGDSSLDSSLFCGSGAAQAVSPGDYAAFMRFALRGSYQAHYTLSSMGFRCARSVQHNEFSGNRE